MRQPVPTDLPPMTREQYRAWAAQQPRGRYEREDGRVVAMSPERLGHNLVKSRVFQALDGALVQQGMPCIAFSDGATVEVDDGTDYEPDVVVSCGEELDLESTAAPGPVIVVEVTSPSSLRLDNAGKLAAYFRVPSIQHYLIVSARRREVIHHRRDGDRIETRIVTSGLITLHPPGIAIPIDAFYERVPL